MSTPPPDESDGTRAAEQPDIVPPESVPPVSAEDLVDGNVTVSHSPPEEERRYPSTIGGAFYIVILLFVGVALAVVVWADWRTGVRMLGGALVFAALVRLALRARDAGMLAVRHKLLDAALLLVLGGLLIFLAGSIPDQPRY